MLVGSLVRFYFGSLMGTLGTEYYLVPDHPRSTVTHAGHPDFPCLVAPPVFFVQETTEYTDVRRIREKLPHAHDRWVTLPARRSRRGERR